MIASDRGAAKRVRITDIVGHVLDPSPDQAACTTESSCDRQRFTETFGRCNGGPDDHWDAPNPTARVLKWHPAHGYHIAPTIIWQVRETVRP